MANKYEQINAEEGKILIVNTQGTLFEVLFDWEDYDRIKVHTWHAHIKKKGTEGRGRDYMRVCTNSAVGYLHRLVLDAPKGMLVDHINRNTLDNRKANLRLTSTQQNAENRLGLDSNNTSGYRGVVFSRASNRFVAQCQRLGVNHYLGLYDTPEEANLAAVNFRRSHMPFSEMDKEAA